MRYFLRTGYFSVLLSVSGFALQTAGEEPAELPVKAKLVDQIRSTLYEVLVNTRLISPESNVANDGYSEGSDGASTENKAVLFAPVQKAIGMTDDQVDSAGSVRERLENLLRIAEANSCKLCHVISSLESFQRETRYNMNVLMEGLWNIKQEQLTLRSLLLAHEISTQRIIDEISVPDGDRISLLENTANKIRALCGDDWEGESAPFVKYDVDDPISHCPHCFWQSGSQDGAEDRSAVDPCCHCFHG
jgi:hypothetical protein